MMHLLVIVLLALDLRVFGFNYPNSAAQNSKNVEVIVYNNLDEEKCPKIVQPLCGTNGKEFLYFENKCQFEVKNYKVLIQGLMEYYECPLSYCKSRCPTCDFVNEPVCAVEILTGVRRTFQNPCEVKRRICKTRREWRILDLRECNLARSYECPEFCTLEYKPVCARFMGLEREFSNECELKTTVCQTKQKWHIISQGSCPPPRYKTITEFYALDSDCPKVCSSAYKPICAKLHNKLRVFKNKCELENSKCLGSDWQIVKEGACLEDGNNLEYMSCPKFCTKEYRPLCAEYKGEHREFGNSCELLKALCETNAKWLTVKLDRCSMNEQNLPAVADDCPKFCNREAKPVCAKFKGEIREFTNKCVLKKLNCDEEEKWEIVHVGPCSTDFNDFFAFESKCPQFCTNEYSPVCAEFQSKLKEFRNKCELEKTICETDTNWNVVKKGHCPLEDQSNNSCPKFCTKEFSPVCASYNGELREFSNNCELERNSCETNIAWQIVKMGPCFSNSSLACPRICLDEYRPVCATYNKSNFRLFKNKCEMHKNACEIKTDWQFLKKGACPSYVADSCPEFCTKEFSPVCARSKGELREFSNSCELKKNSCETLTEWHIVNLGRCIVQKAEDFVVNILCENEALDPICAQNDSKKRTFNNLCQLADEIKRSQLNWSILHKGICSSNTSPGASAGADTNTNPPTTKTLQESSTAAITTTLTSTKYNTTESATTSDETTIPTTTYNLKTTTDEYGKYSSGTPINGYENSSRKKSEQIYDDKEKEYKTSTASSSSEENISLNYSTDSGFETSSSWTEEQLNTSHSYETKSPENYINVKEKIYDNNESYLKGNVYKYITSSEVTSTESSKSYSEENYVIENKSEERYIRTDEIVSNDSSASDYESKKSIKYNDVLEKRKDKTYFENTKINGEHLTTPISYNSKDPARRLSSKPKSNVNRTDNQSSKPNKYINSKYVNKARLNEWLRKQIEVMLSRRADSQSFEESGSDEKELYHSHIVKHLNALSESDSDESLEATSSNDDYGKQVSSSQQIETSTNIKSLYETKPDFAANDNKTYENQNDLKDRKYKNSSRLSDQSKQTLRYNSENVKEYKGNLYDNNATKLGAYGNVLVKGNAVESGNPNENKTTVSSFAQGQYASTYNSSQPKKGEVYNGIVYKAPVYDAPTYNFIYTAPFHYHGLAANNTSLKNASVVNQTLSRATTNDSPHPFHHFLSSLAAVNGGLPKPNFFPVPKEVKNSLVPPNNKGEPLAFPTYQAVAQPSARDKEFAAALATFNNNFDSKIANERPKGQAGMPLLRSKTYNALASVPSQVSSYSADMSHQPLIPKQFALSPAPVPLDSANSPQISLNSTMLNKIIETLKIITNRY